MEGYSVEEAAAILGLRARHGQEPVLARAGPACAAAHAVPAEPDRPTRRRTVTLERPDGPARQCASHPRNEGITIVTELTPAVRLIRHGRAGRLPCRRCSTTSVRGRDRATMSPPAPRAPPRSPRSTRSPTCSPTRAAAGRRCPTTSPQPRRGARTRQPSSEPRRAVARRARAARRGRRRPARRSAPGRAAVGWMAGGSGGRRDRGLGSTALSRTRRRQSTASSNAGRAELRPSAAAAASELEPGRRHDGSAAPATAPAGGALSSAYAGRATRGSLPARSRSLPDARGAALDGQAHERAAQARFRAPRCSSTAGRGRTGSASRRCAGGQAWRRRREP